MVGTRLSDLGLHFPVSEAAARYGASVANETVGPRRGLRRQGVRPRSPRAVLAAGGMTVPEARMTDTDAGAQVSSEGWFVVNLADAAGARTPDLGAYIPLDTGETQFPQFGINVHVLEPGEPNGMYHRENAQEGFMVLHGECLLIVEEEERPMRQWDFFHCPPGVDHIIVGAGEGPCAILMIGRRGGGVRTQVSYPFKRRSPLATAARFETTEGIAREHAYEHVETQADSRAARLAAEGLSGGPPR